MLRARNGSEIGKILPNYLFVMPGTGLVLPLILEGLLRPVEEYSKRFERSQKSLGAARLLFPRLYKLRHLL
jgi:hypothetical protein